MLQDRWRFVSGTVVDDQDLGVTVKLIHNGLQLGQ